jgi:CO/xanthine dehydrogenase FAD-binding subunit
MTSLHYAAPTSIAEATQLLQANSGAKVLAGGTDLLVQMKLGLREPKFIVDIKNIQDLMTIEVGEQSVRLGAAVPGAVVTRHSQFGEIYPGFVEALGIIGSDQIQGRCSAGGNLCNASPAADSVPSLIVNRATCHIAGPGGQRSVAAEEFTIGPGSNCLAEDEFLVSIEIPRPPPRSSDAYLRFIPRTEMDIAVAGAAVALTLDDAGVCTRARVAIGAVAPTALLVEEAGEALVGSQLDPASLESAARAASDAAKPITDKRGTAEYRKKVIGVLVRRAAALAKARIESTT